MDGGSHYTGRHNDALSYRVYRFLKCYAFQELNFSEFLVFENFTIRHAFFLYFFLSICFPTI